MDFTPVSTGPTHSFAGLRNVLVCLYVGSPDAAALRDRLPWVERSIEEYGAVGLFIVIDERASGFLPDRAFRDESRAQADRFRKEILFSASVIQGSDVHHILIRTFLRSLAVVVAHDIPVRFFDRVAPAAGWAESLAKGHRGPTAADIEQAVEKLRGV